MLKAKLFDWIFNQGKRRFIIHKFQFLQSAFAILPVIKSKLGACLNKGLLFYLIVILAVSIFGLFIFGSSSALKSLEEFSFLASAVESGQDLFATGSNNLAKESPSMNFVQKNSLVAVAPTMTIDVDVLGSMIGGLEDDAIRKDILEYIVEPGDSLSTIASKFDISLSTILIANDLSSRSTIKPGQKLIILPVTGVIYHVKKGDTLSDVAKTYKGKAEEIIAVNDLSSEGGIFIGDILVIPNGKIPVSRVYASSIPVGSSYFIAPVAKYKITQGLHWYNAIDFATSCGTSIYAAAAGTIQRVEYGWNGGAGNYLRILHPNGIVTMYGHVQRSLVVQGQKVSQGERIALIGGRPGMPGAGKSTGCHVHFDVRGAKNPFR